MNLDETLAPALALRREQYRYRSRKVSDDAPSLQFCSNDYLGLARHPQVVAAFKTAADHYGVGSRASHLVNGHSREHHLLEEELAAFTGRDRALLFSSGYAANMGLINALLEKPDGVFQDKLNHASLLDGAQLSLADHCRYRHVHTEHLEERLSASSARRKLVVTDGVFSMDGDIAPLAAMVPIAEKHKAWLMVDDAHGLGVLGERGAGSIEQAGLGQREVPILMGTLGKAFGTAGAFVAGSETLIESLIQFCRPYIYTTALPPALAAATRASLAIVQKETELRERLHSLIAYFRRGCEQLGLRMANSSTAIQPLILGEDALALQWADTLWQQGIWVSAIRPPTVPPGTARLRITLTAAHTSEQVDRLLEGLSHCQQQHR